MPGLLDRLRVKSPRMSHGCHLLPLLFVGFVDGLPCCSYVGLQSSLSSLMLAWLPETASVLSASRGGAVKLDGVAGLLAVAELLSPS